MNRDFEYLTSNTFTAHPFVEDNELAKLVADAYAMLVSDKQLDIKIVVLGDPADPECDIQLQYSDNSTAFEFNPLTDFFQSYVFGVWTVLEWKSLAGLVRLTVLTARIADYTWPVAPSEAYLVTTTIQPLVPQVWSMGAHGFSFGYGESVELVAGNNIRLSVVEDPGLGLVPTARGRKFIQVDVESGAGDGKYQDCNPEAGQAIYTINGIGPDDRGNFSIVPIDCYKFERPVAGMPDDSLAAYTSIDDMVEGVDGMKELLQVDFQVDIEGIKDELPYTSSLVAPFYTRQDALNFGRQTAEQLEVTQAAISVTQLEDMPWEALQSKMAAMAARVQLLKTRMDTGLAESGPPWYEVAHTLQLQNDCQPCCACEDYIWVYDTVMREVAERARTISAWFYDLRDSMQTLIDKVIDEKICREGPRIKLRFEAQGGWTSSLSIIIQNSQPCTVENFTLAGAFTGGGAGKITQITASRNDGSIIDLGTGSYPNFSVPYNETVLGTKSVVITVDVYYLEGGGRAPEAPLGVAVGGSIAGFPVWATASTVMEGPYNKD